MDDMTAVAAIGGTDIRKMMKSQGPIVNTVILRCAQSSSPSPPPGDNDNDNSNDNKEAKEDSKPAAIENIKTKEASSDNANENANEAATTTAAKPKPRVVLTDLIEEVKIDTTPSKSKVSELLGGPFTFLGQYEDEGIVLMVRNLPDDLEEVLEGIYNNSDDDDDDDGDEEKENDTTANKPSFSFSEQLSKNFNIKALKAVCFQRDIDTEGMKEKEELVRALVEYQNNLPPYNTHQLQSPLHKARVRGDIVIMKVAETEEELDNDEDEDGNDDSDSNSNSNSNSNGESTKVDKEDKKDDDKDSTKEETPIESSSETESKAEVIAVPTNEEFFLDYSKDAYVKFASRTDIPEHEIEIAECDDDDDDEVEGGNGEASMMGGDDGDDDDDDDEIDETDKSAMFNLVMNEVLRQYREENGRGPNTKELLELRSNIAKELGVEISHEIDGDWDKMAKANTVPSAKKIAFNKAPDRVREYVPDANEYPSDRDDDDDVYDDDDNDNDNDVSDGVARSLMNDYDEEKGDDDDNDYTDEPPTKRLKTSNDDKDEEDSKPAAAAAAST